MGRSLLQRLAAARSSADTSLLVDLGCDLSDKGAHLDAAWCFRRAVDLGQEWVTFNLGNELVALGRHRQAVVGYERAISVGETDAWLNLGLALEDLGDLAGALRAYESGQSAGDVNAGIARAFLLRGTDDRASASAVIEQLAFAGSPLADAIAACWEYDRTSNPELEDRLRAGADLYPGARADLAAVLRDAGRLHEALDVLERGTMLGEVESFLPLGNLYSDNLDQPHKAEATYRAGVAAGDLHCHHNLGVLLEDQERYSEAHEQFSLAAAGGDTLARQALARLDDD